MAKTQVSASSVQTAQVVPFALVYWLAANNERDKDNYGDTDAIRNSIAERGWFLNNPVSAMLIQRDEDLTEEERKRGRKSELALALEERGNRWKVLKETATNEEAQSELTVFERLFVKNGKLIEPKYSGNAGFRRASAFEAAMLQRFRNKKDNIPENERILDLVPIVVKSYASEADRIIDQQLENELQGIGTVKVPDANKLKIARKLFTMGLREIHLRKLYTATTGQKLFNICLADHNWPKLRIYDRFFLGETDTSRIPFPPVRHDALIRFNNRFEADVKRAAGKPLTDKERTYEPITQEEVAAYFNDCRTGGGDRAEKIMAKKDIAGVAKQNGVHFFRVPMQCVLDNNITGMSEYLDYADQLNLHKELIDAGNGDLAHSALSFAKENPETLPVVRDALLTLSKEEVSALLKGAVASKKKAATPVVSK